MLRLRNGLRTDGRIDWEVLGVQVNRGEVTLYGEDQNNDQKGLDQSGDGAELAPPQNFYRTEALHMPPLKAKQVHLQLKAIPNWSKRAQTLFRTFKFEGFLKSIDFVNRIAKRAEKSNHHPDIDIRFNKVTLTLSTHDEGGITEKDFSLARQCDEVFSKL